jgi:hypothetical protein
MCLESVSVAVAHTGFELAWGTSRSFAATIASYETPRSTPGLPMRCTHALVMGGAHEVKYTFLAPASRAMRTISREVVPIMFNQTL